MYDYLNKYLNFKKSKRGRIRKINIENIGQIKSLTMQI